MLTNRLTYYSFASFVGVVTQQIIKITVNTEACHQNPLASFKYNSEPS